MRVALVGAGSMGTVIGAYLTKGGIDVEMFDAHEGNVKALQENGATIQHLEPERTFTIPVKAFTPDKMSGIYDLILLTTKQTANPVVLPNLLKYMNENSIICALQNGIPEPSVAEIVGLERTIGGSMLFSSTWQGPGVSAATGTYDLLKETSFEIGEIGKPSTPRLYQVQDVLRHVGGTKVMDNLMDVRWTKLIINCCGSGMSAALGCTFGEAVDNERALACFAFIARECTRVCKAEGFQMMSIYGVNFDMDWETKEEMRAIMVKWRDLYHMAPGGKASMLQDLEKGLKTEATFINGHTAAFGKKHGIFTPFCDMVVTLVQEAEERKGINSLDDVSRFDELLADYMDVIESMKL